MSYWIAHLENGNSYSERKLEKEVKISPWIWLRENNYLEKLTSLELKTPDGNLINIPKRHPSWQYFQFKQAEAIPQLNITNKSLMQCIGAVVDDQGNSIIACYILSSPDILITIDNVHNLKIARIGHINFELHNIKLPIPVIGCRKCEKGW